MYKRNGFTLVELLVVISIIGILSTIGISGFNNAQNKTKDVKRKSDVDAVVKAFEGKYNASTFSYETVINSDFNNSKPPIPPEGGNYSVKVCKQSSEDIKAYQICTPLGQFSGDCPTPEGDKTKCYCRASALGDMDKCIAGGGTLSSLTIGDVVLAGLDLGGKEGDVSPSLTSSSSPIPSTSPPPTTGLKGDKAADKKATAKSKSKPKSSQEAAPIGSVGNCTIASASWDLPAGSSGTVSKNTHVGLRVHTTGSCENIRLRMTVWEDDSLFGLFDPYLRDPATIQPAEIILGPTENGLITAGWVAEYQQDGAMGFNDPPEFYFIATISDLANSSFVNLKSADPMIRVEGGSIDYNCEGAGDINNDGVINQTDINRFGTNNLSREDLDGDGVI